MIEYPIAFILGILSWRIIANGVQIWSIGKKFVLTPQPGHPDRCGGFEALGNICLWNTLIVSVAGLHLGGWIIAGVALGPSEGVCKGTMLLLDEKYLPSYSCLGLHWLPIYLLLLLVPFCLAIIGFVAPVWRVHQTMLAQRSEQLRRLEELGQQIDDLAKNMLDLVDTLRADEGETMARNLQLKRRIYQQSKKYPLWPFNFGMYLKFTLAQMMPVLSLVASVVVPLALK